VIRVLCGNMRMKEFENGVLENISKYLIINIELDKRE